MVRGCWARRILVPGSMRSVILAQVVPLPISSLLAAYGFSEGSGSTTADASGNGHTMSLNTVSWGSGHSGFGLTNTAASLGARAALTAPANSVTIMAWIQPLDLTVNTTHAAFGFMDNGGNSDVVIFTQRADFGTSNVLQGDIRLGGTLTPIYGPTLTVGTWTHIALTYNTSQIKLYKDGLLIATVAALGSISPGDGLFVAGWSAATYEDSDVTIDDVRVFNTALSESQIASAMRKSVV